MRRASELVGKSIVTSDTGEDVGRAADILVSEDGTHLVGIVITHGVLGGEKGVLRFEQVQSLGRDVIVAKGEPAILDGEEWADQKVATIRSSSFTHKHIVTTDGRDLGEINDLCVDERDGSVSGYEIAESGFAGLVQRHRIVERSPHVVIGPDVVLVDADAVAPLESEDRVSAETREPAAGIASDGPQHREPVRHSASAVKPETAPGMRGHGRPIEPRK